MEIEDIELIDRLAREAGFVVTAIHPTTAPFPAGWACDRQALRNLCLEVQRLTAEECAKVAERAGQLQARGEDPSAEAVAAAIRALIKR